MDLQGLESFLTVVHTKSISKAAGFLHITQPTLSTRIRRLEEDLGFQLLERSWEGVKLSKKGHYFLPYTVHFLHQLNNASTVISDFDDLVSDTYVKDENNNFNSLRIGMNIWLAPVFANAIITELTNHFPQLEFSFVTRPTNTLKKLMEYDELDMAIYYQNDTISQHFSQVLIKDEMVLLCSNTDWSMIGKDPKNIMLLDKPFLLFDNPVLANNTKFINTIRSRLNIHKCHMVDHVNVMLSLIAFDKGYIVIPKTGLYQLGNTSSLPITVVPLGNKFPSIDIHLEYNKNSPLITPIQSIEKKLFTTFKIENAS
jgi:DNA-binding transcriptional LysR family regulator